MMLSICTCEVNTKKKFVELTGNDVESWMMDSLDANIDELPVVTYRFDLNVPGNSKYLLKLVSSVKKCDAPTMQERICQLCGEIIYINDRFRITK